jgi:hypothetical protein
MKLLHGVALAAGLLIAGSASAATNLITNGSFETGDFSGWTRTGSVPDGYIASIIKLQLQQQLSGRRVRRARSPGRYRVRSPDPVGNPRRLFRRRRRR